METKDIIGREFTCFEFKSDSQLHYDEKEAYLGFIAVVKSLHATYPEYARVMVTDKDGNKREPHYPTAMIKEQLEAKDKEENQSIDDILNEMKQLISKI